MRSLGRLLLLAGGIGLAWYLHGAAPRDVVLVYGVPAGSPGTVLEVELRRGAEVVRHAELAVPPSGGEVRHPVRLKDGAYDLRWRLAERGGGRAREGRRGLEISEDATVVVPLGP